MSGKLKDRISQFELSNGVVSSSQRHTGAEDVTNPKPLSFKDARAAFESSNKTAPAPAQTKTAIGSRKPDDEATYVLPSSIKAAQKPRAVGALSLKSPGNSAIKTQPISQPISQTRQTIASQGVTLQSATISSKRLINSLDKQSLGVSRPPAPSLATKPSPPAPKELVRTKQSVNESKQQSMIASGESALKVKVLTPPKPAVSTKPNATKVEPSSVPSDYSSQDSSSDEADQEREIAIALKDTLPGKKTPPVPPPTRKSTNSSNTTSISDNSSISYTPSLPPRVPSRTAAESSLNVKPLAPSLPPRQTMSDTEDKPILSRQSTLPPPVKKSIEARRQAQARAQATARQSQALRKTQSKSVPAGQTSAREPMTTKPVSPDTPTPQQRRRYEALFDANSTAGTVSALVVRAIWTRSNLDQFALYRIYSLVDRGHKAQLVKEEFVVGTWFIDQRLADKPIPTSVGQLL